MASTEIVTIPSSPFKSQPFTLSSSPLPSPSDICRKHAPFVARGNSPAGILGNGLSITGTASFRKASHLDLSTLESIPLQNRLEEPASKPRQKKVSIKKSKTSGIKEPNISRKPAAKSSEDLKSTPKEKKPRKSRAKKADVDTQRNLGEVKDEIRDGEAVNDATIKVKRVRKSRAKKTTEDAQTKLSCPVTKPSSKPRTSSKKDSAAKKDLCVNLETVEYGLVKAVKRRTNWSPPSKSSGPQMSSVRTFDTLSNANSPEAIVSGANSFNDMLGGFAFTNVESQVTLAAKQAPQAGVVKKRKLIELINTGFTTETATPKAKAPKKKTTTITGLATSAFMEKKADALDPEPAPLLQYFSYKTTDRITKGGINLASKSRSRSPVKRAKKGSNAQVPILLSPESALKQARQQDFVFGTSSQLAREESPTYLRDLHQAMQASNVVAEDPFEDPFKDVVDEPSAVAPRGRLRVSSKKGSLWSAGARDAAGSLLDVEMVDITETPVTARQSSLHMTISTVPATYDVWHDVEEDIGVVPNPLATPSKPGPVEAAIRLQLSSSPVTASPTRAKSLKLSAKAKEIVPAAGKGEKSAYPADEQMPDYGAYTMFQLQKQIGLYHFKPIKSRVAMIAVLEKCWEEQHNRSALASLTTNTKSPVKTQKVKAADRQETGSLETRGQPKKTTTANDPVSPSKTKKRLGRPKKVHATESEDSDVPLSQSQKRKKSPKRSPKKAVGKLIQDPVDDTLDSEPLTTPSPRRRRPSQVEDFPPPLKVFASSAVDALPASSQEALFKNITTAIKSLSPTKDPSQPTWHEKILLYDPIVLEDLTVWLNTGALEKIGWDGEVEPKVVKKWCESKGICCLWKENLRGGSRSRY
jgi:hypothetical protein